MPDETAVFASTGARLKPDFSSPLAATTPMLKLAPTSCYRSFGTVAAASPCRARHRPPGDDPDRRRHNPRGHRLPKEPERSPPHDRRAFFEKTYFTQERQDLISEGHRPAGERFLT